MTSQERFLCILGASCIVSSCEVSCSKLHYLALFRSNQITQPLLAMIGRAKELDIHFKIRIGDILCFFLQRKTSTYDILTNQSSDILQHSRNRQQKTLKHDNPDSKRKFDKPK